MRNDINITVRYKADIAGESVDIDKKINSKQELVKLWAKAFLSQATDKSMGSLNRQLEKAMEGHFLAYIRENMTREQQLKLLNSTLHAVSVNPHLQVNNPHISELVRLKKSLEEITAQAKAPTEKLSSEKISPLSGETANPDRAIRVPKSIKLKDGTIIHFSKAQQQAFAAKKPVFVRNANGDRFMIGPVLNRDGKTYKVKMAASPSAKKRIIDAFRSIKQKSSISTKIS
ncbi:hypothetical protein [Parapedobacter sp. 10938]|uniref:hypothetical protein n=1 Tax=Parapedobacter flavus TaxID=3110225 RepID=UPI002DBE4E47|nr:hypothetical protein [Parapedobacter sp. 10938]MEC3881809.1 hypothetical protein [Parapedobacter sp. 10938]